jgi:hypothetical protein
MKHGTGKAALQGSIFHQTMEWMARLKQRGKTNVDPMWLLDRAWDELTSQSPEISIRKVTTRRDKETGALKEAADFKKCRVAVETVLNDSFYNPYNLDIIDIERWFALELPGEEWCCVDKDGKRHQFAVRGLIDLVHEIDKDTLEIIDWKSGNRKSFYTQTEIDEKTLSMEIQPRLYHLAAHFLYPQYKNILITFFYANDSGPITISLSQEDLAFTIALLYRFFTTVSEDTLVIRNRHWTCRMCGYERNGVCHRVWSDLHALGGDYVKDRYFGLDWKDQLAIGKPKEKIS